MKVASNHHRSAKVAASHASMKCCNPPEPVKKHEYDYKTGKWSVQEIWVQLGAQPFEEGTLRYIYYTLDLSKPEGQQECAAKLSKNPAESRESYFQDVIMHAKAKHLADEFNALNPPKRVDFVLPLVLEFKLRKAPNGKGNLCMNCEPFLKGTYKKYSNNFGFVSGDERNTPHAFSHFTHHFSGGKLLVCDIQGVDDLYTDPQIHSIDRLHNWGKGDMGLQGIIQFFKTHHCSSICEYLKLPKHPAQAKTSRKGQTPNSNHWAPLRSVQMPAAQPASLPKPSSAALPKPGSAAPTPQPKPVVVPVGNHPTAQTPPPPSPAPFVAAVPMVSSPTTQPKTPTTTKFIRRSSLTSGAVANTNAAPFIPAPKANSVATTPIQFNRSMSTSAKDVYNPVKEMANVTPAAVAAATPTHMTTSVSYKPLRGNNVALNIVSGPSNSSATTSSDHSAELTKNIVNVRPARQSSRSNAMAANRSSSAPYNDFVMKQPAVASVAPSRVNSQ